MIDDLDRGIMDLLRQDPRTSNKVMARALRVSESTVGARLERLSSQNIARVIGQRHYRSEGWTVTAMLEIWTKAADNESLIEHLNGDEHVVTIYELTGAPQLLIKIAADDVTQIMAIAHEFIGSNSEVDRVSVQVCLRHAYVRQGFGNLEAPRSSVHSTDGDTAHRIVDILSRDGRISNREIARTLGMAEATVRAKVRKLIEQRELQYTLVVDPAKAGYSALAFALFSIRSGDLDRVIDQVSVYPEVFGATVITGRRNLLLSVYTADWESTLGIFEQISSIMPAENEPLIRLAKQFARHRFQLSFVPRS